MRSSLVSFSLLAFVLSVLIGLFGSALSKSIVLEPQVNRIGLSGVAKDGWMESNASLNLKIFEGEISKIKFKFDAWRPKGEKPANISFVACGAELSNQLIKAAGNENFGFSIRTLKEFVKKLIGADATEVAISLPTDCKAELIEINTKNPIRAADGRRLGVRLEKITIKYPLSKNLHFDQVAIIGSATLFILLISIYLLNFPTKIFLAAVTLISVTSLVSFSYMDWDNQWQLLCLAVVITLLAFGYNPKFYNRILQSDQLNFEKSPFAFVIFITIIAALIRFYGTDFGLPEHYHPDEPRKAQIARRMAVEGNLDPNYFLHPTLLLYLSALYGKIGYALGFFDKLDITEINLSGRLVSATAGSLAVPVLFFICRNLFSNPVAILSSVILTFAPLNVTCSRYFKEDSLLTFFVLLTVLIVVRAVKNDRPRDLLLASFVAGLSSSSKYSGFMSAAAIFFAPWLKSKSPLPDYRFFIWGFFSSVLLPVGFVLASPYVLLNNEKFLNHFNAEQEHMLTGHHKVIISSWSQYWMYHFSRSILDAITWPVAIAGVLGFGMMLRNSFTKGFYILVMFLAFYLPAEAVNAKPPPQPERYILPCLPFLIIAAAYFVNSLKIIGYRSISFVLLLILVLVPIYRSVGLAREIYPDTRVMMKDWIVENIPHGSKIAIDAQAYSAFLPQDKFNVELMWTIPQRQEMTLENLKSQGIQYILMTNKSYERYFLTKSADQVIRARIEDIFNKWVLVKEFQTKFGSYGFSNPVLSLYKVELK